MKEFCVIALAMMLTGLLIVYKYTVLSAVFMFGFLVGRMKIKKGKREKCFRRDGHKCTKCGSREDLTIDHIIPRSLGGQDWRINLQVLCRNCNEEKGSDIKIYSKRIGNRIEKHIVGLYEQKTEKKGIKETTCKMG